MYEYMKNQVKWNELKRKSTVKKITKKKTEIGPGKGRDWRQHINLS